MVELPRQTAHPQLAPGVYLPEEQDRRILIVDDEEILRSLLAAQLSESYICDTAANYNEAVSLLGRQAYSLVITDMIMPGLGGIELLREVVARFPDTGVIIVSGVDRSQRVRDALRQGAFDYLIKPFDCDALELSVERALERRALVRDARRYKRDLERSNAELRETNARLERLQAQIVQSEKMASLGQLAAGIAHELNNPSGFIYGNMQMLGECVQGLERLLAFYEGARLAPGDEAAAHALKDEVDYEHTLGDLHAIIADCREGAERIRDVVQNLRTFSRLDEAEFKKVDIHDGIESTLRLLSRYFSSGAVTLRREYGLLPPVDCYAGQLNQVWMNLLANAAHAVQDGGSVSVATESRGDCVVVRVRDTGCGIAPENLPRVFDPFFTTKPVGEGTGLGLSVTYGIVERHGGRIEVESRLGEGTVFTVMIPVDAQRRAAQESAPIEDAAALACR
ncbi:MAG TPA: ATP-binding protein [Pyrinomonadaceae bacterium]|jgi:signal transduction histidine kinase|nr:ATP-binding protein [Pyrinomonadaceae bacterium]